MEEQSRILVVDDIPNNIALIEKFFTNANYQIHSAQNGYDAIDIVTKNPPDLILLDVIMPGIDGFEVARRIKNDVKTRLLPIIMITALDDSESKIKGIEIGVDDFISKPINLLELRARVASLLRLKKYTDELENAEKIIFSLALAVEAKDPYTKGHCNRLAEYGAILGEQLSLSPDEIKNIRRGAILHDIGKIAIADQILLKKGPLNTNEFDVIKTHPEIGEKICKPLKTLRPVLPIIRGHQERYNGSGYPDGLMKDEISLPVQIVGLVDSFDALTTDRPYRKSLSNAEAFLTLENEMRQGLWNRDLLYEFRSVINSMSELTIEVHENQDALYN